MSSASRSDVASQRSVMPNFSKRHSSHISLAITLLLSALLLLLAFNGANWREIAARVLTAHLELLALGMAMGVVSLFLRGARWWTLLREGTGVSLGTVCWATNIGYLANSYLPARGGDLIRCAFVGFSANITKSFAMATTLTERLLDVAALALIGAAMLTLLDGPPLWLESTAAVVGVLATLAIVGLVALCRFERPILEWVGSLSVLGRSRGRFVRFGEQLFLGFGRFQRPHRALAFTFFTAAIWLVDGLGTVVGAEALGLKLSVPQGLVLLAALGLASALPSTPGYVGIYQFVAVTILVPFGYSRDEALSYILVSQALYYAVVTALGVVGLLRLGTGRDEARSKLLVKREGD